MVENMELKKWNPRDHKPQTEHLLRAFKERTPASDLKTKPGNWTAGKLFGILLKALPLRSGVRTMWERETETEFLSPAAKKPRSSSTSPGPSGPSAPPPLRR